MVHKFNKILLYAFDNSLEKELKKYCKDIKIVTVKEDYAGKLKIKDFENVDCFIVDVFDNFKNEFLKNIKFIGTNFTDLSMFDLDYLKKI